MNVAVQAGGRSPKLMNSPTSSQLKAGSDSVQSSGSSFGSQRKGKKRRRGDRASEPVKRERLAKTEDSESVHYRLESSLKSELARFTDKGGVVDSEGVEKLVQLMVPDSHDKKIDLACRSMLAGVIASTDKFDCLSQFVQLRGLCVFDEWLQEVRKGKIGNSTGAKDADRRVEEFLLVLLCALDKLPVNLQALQMCNIGKSVNHLRSHKNIEIQKKSRSLVDTWKKRVEAEMNINDTKSSSNQAVSWPTRTRHSEASHGGSRHYVGSSERTVKNMGTQIPSPKYASGKPDQVEAAMKSASVSPGSVKSSSSPLSATTNLKDGQSCPSSAGGSSDPSAIARDDKGSIPNHSYNNSQPCSSDHAKLAGSASKEDTRTSTAGSVTANKSSGSRHRKSATCFSGLSGIRRESGSSRSSSLHRASASDKELNPGLTGERTVESPAEGSTHKLIVKIPNRGRSSAHGATGGSLDDPSAMNVRDSSPIRSEKHDCKLKEKSDTCRADNSSEVTKETCQVNDLQGDSDVRRMSPSGSPDEVHSRTGDEDKKVVDRSKTASQSSGNEHKSNKLHEDSLSSINVLIESCVKYSESNTSSSVADDGGMNLLASVATGEMSKFDLVYPTGSSERNSSLVDKSSRAKSKGDDAAPKQIRSNVGVGNKHEKLEEHSGCTSSGMYMQQHAETCIESNGNLNESGAAGDSMSVSPGTLDRTADSRDRQSKENTSFNCANANFNDDCNPESIECSLKEKKANDAIAGVVVKMGDGERTSGSSLEFRNKKNINEELDSTLKREQKPPPGFFKVKSEEVLTPSGSGRNIIPDNVDEVKTENADERDTTCDSDQAEKKKTNLDTNSTMKIENQVRTVSIVTASTDKKLDSVLGNFSGTDGREQPSSGPGPSGVPSTVVTQEVEKSVQSKLKLNDANIDDAEECTSSAHDASTLPATLRTDTDTKAAFDLNEGLDADGGRYVEQNNVTVAGCTGPVPIISPFPFSASSLSNGLPASITVAAPAKGPFVPPEDLLRNRGQLGWKGSAATSAFRPAEPRRNVEMSAVSSNSALFAPEVSLSKRSRPRLDIDLNVPDERTLEDIASCSNPQEMGSATESAKRYNDAVLQSSGGLGLDLNQVVESNDLGNCSGSNILRLDVPFLPVKVSSSCLPNDEGNACRGFDLNDGPLVEEATTEPMQYYQQTRSNMPEQAPVIGIRMNDADTGNFSSWFPPRNSYSAVAIPSALPDRGEQNFPVVASGGPQRMLATPAVGTPFNADMFRGPVLSSSPTAPFASTPFQYPVFPFGTSFPLPSPAFSGGSATYLDSTTGGRLCYSAAPSQLLGHNAAVSSSFPRPYVFSLTDGSSNSGAESSRQWGRHGLDLNAGPGGHDMEGRDETISPFAPRQLSIPSSQAPTEEHARIYQVPGGLLKRKEPEGGWDGYRQFSWQ